MSEPSDDIRAVPPAPVPTRRPIVVLFGAGVGGGVWSALMQIAATPFYLRLLGVEGYGLIGFYTAMQALLQVLDLGVAITVSREVARLTAARRTDELRDLVRTLELLYWIAALVVGLAIVAASAPIAAGWFRDAQLSSRELQRVLIVMALLWAAQWLTSFYQAALIGLEQFGRLNLLKALAATAMHLGAVLWLSAVSATPFSLFAFQAAVAAAFLITNALVATGGLPPAGRAPRVRPELVAARWRFTGAVAGITIFGTLLAQSDKVIVSGVLPLRDFGFYSLASLVAASLFIAVVPMFHVILPRLSAYTAAGDDEAVHELYRNATQAITVLAAVPASIVAFFGGEVIAIWTADAEVARQTATIAAVLVAGSALNALTNPPYALQLATGATRVPLVSAIVQLIAFVPLVIVLASRYGALGAAVVWPLIQVGYVAFSVWHAHRRLLGADPSLWLRDTIPPAAAAAIAAALLSRVDAAAAPTAVRLAYLAFAGAAVLVASVLAAPRIRTATISFARRFVHI